MNKNEIKFGTKEWAPYNFNYCNGCSNDCVYCYAKDMAIRFKRKRYDDWCEMEMLDISKKAFTKKNGMIMIPSSHDITPENIELTLEVFDKLLNKGTKLLVVTKPNFNCIKKIIDRFMKFKNNITFRFTIGSVDTNILKLWEPNAPSFDERLNSLKFAFDNGFKTSVSCEPLLDNNFDKLYELIKEFVTEKIWVGKMNSPMKRVCCNTNSLFPTNKIKEIIEFQSDDEIIKLYNKYNDNKKIEWKESIKKVILNHNIKLV